LGSADDPSVVYNVSGATFNYLAKGIFYDQQVQGLTVSQSNFVGDEYGIYVPAGLSGLDQLTVQGSQFNCSSAGIYVGTYLSNTLFSANLFIVPNTGTGVSPAAGLSFQPDGQLVQYRKLGQERDLPNRDRCWKHGGRRGDHRKSVR
jgi:hypothetical protein